MNLSLAPGCPEAAGSLVPLLFNIDPNAEAFEEGLLRDGLSDALATGTGTKLRFRGADVIASGWLTAVQISTPDWEVLAYQQSRGTCSIAEEWRVTFEGDDAAFEAWAGKVHWPLLLVQAD